MGSDDILTILEGRAEGRHEGCDCLPDFDACVDEIIRLREALTEIRDDPCGECMAFEIADSTLAASTGEAPDGE